VATIAWAFKAWSKQGEFGYPYDQIAVRTTGADAAAQTNRDKG
jgi:hypothetical protein